MSSTKPSSTSDWEPPSPEELQALLPQYEISAILGRGGMGAVYRGRQVNLDRDVAIKLLPENLAEGEDELNFVARFKQEARSMAKLDHPAIISVHDFGETSAGQLYFVMEFIDGMDIHQYLHSHGGKLPQEQALNIVAHVLDALDYAHSHGIVHRDIKPANILLNQEGRVKIADFGLAKKFGEAVDPSAPMLTMSNVAVGTPDFVAPEALDPDATPDHRADLYAVGVMLYQMLTGRIPRGNYRTPSEMDAEIDPRLDAIVSKAMASDPDYRYPSAAAVRADLDEIFSRPFAKAEAGEESAAVAAAVPVTTSVKEGGKPRSRPQPAPREQPKVSLYLGIATAAVLAVGLIVMATRGGNEEEPSGTGIVSVASTEEASEPEPAPIATDHGVSPAENIGRVAQAQEESSTGILPVASTGQTGEPEPAPIAPNPAPEAPSAEERGTGIPPVASTEQTVEPAPPAPEPAVSPPMPQDTEGAAPNQEPSTKNEGLLAIPGLLTRLDAYLAARRDGIGDLASKYGRALDAGLNQAADAGNLDLVSAFREEKARLEAVQSALAGTDADSFRQVSEAPGLPPLADETPEGLASLRATWNGELARIREDLDGKLDLSLQALEAERTRAREFEEAASVRAYRESLAGAREGGAPMIAGGGAAGPEPVPVKDPPGGEGENPFGWRPIPENPFPLPMPERPTTPCRVVAWRLDGEPVDEAHFRELFGGVPAELGEVVDFDSDPSTNSTYRALVGISPAGPVVSSYRTISSQFESITSATRVAVGNNVCIVLASDGSAKAFLYNPGMRSRSQDVVADLDRVSEWTGLVQVRAGNIHVTALDTSGKIHLAGRNDRNQLDIPAGIDDGVVMIGTSFDHSSAVKREGGSMAITSFGSIARQDTAELGERIFLGYQIYLASPSGRLTWDSVPSAYAARHGNLRGGRSSDVLDIVQGIGGHLAAAREGEDRWRFWGAMPDDQGGFDARHCDTRAAGAWKLVISPPYVLALKPVAKLTPEDWAGAPQGEANPTALPAHTTDNPLRAAKEEPFENSLGMKFVPVPGTDVLFCIHETRWRDYAAYAAEAEGVDGSWRSQEADGFTPTNRPEDHPVTRVNWEDAQAFCAWLSEKESRTYRLPTDHEWSVAVGLGRLERPRSGDTPESLSEKVADEFPWGKGWPPPEGAGNYSDESRRTKAPRDDGNYLDGYDDGYPTTAPVMSFAPNECGLYDLGGNVWEWCENWFNDAHERRALRGGSWYGNTEIHLGSSYRERLTPASRRHSTGFRVIVVPSSSGR